MRDMFRRTALLAVLLSGFLGLMVQPASAALDGLTVGEGETKTFTVEDGDATVEVVASVQADGKPQPAAQRCWIGTIDYKATSVGMQQHTWRHEVHWCFNGNTAAGAHVNRGVNVASNNWEWLGNGTAPQKFNRGSFMDVRNQGHYQRCTPVIPYCQDHFPTHHGNYYKGRFTTTLGRAK
jgi:hypothetical protein